MKSFTIAQLMAKKSATAAATASSSKPHVITMRPRPSSASLSAATRVAAMRAAAPSVAGARRAAAGSVPHNFDGVDAIQNAAVSGFDLEPPDESMAVGGGYVLSLVNLAGAFYNRNGGLVAGPFPTGLIGASGGFFNTDNDNIVSDPRAYFDASSHTWFALVWEDDFVSGVPGPAFVDLAVNSGNPVTGTWNLYKISVSDDAAAGCPCLPDFTILGVDQSNVYLLPNEFQNFGPGFNGSQIYTLAKSQLIAGVASPNVVHFSGLNIGGSVVYHLQPAVEHSNSSAEYFVNSLDPNNTFDNRLGVWAMTNRDHIAQGVIPTLTSTIISSETYAMPPDAQTPPGFSIGVGEATTGDVTGDFDALQETQYINGTLYAALATSVNIPGDTNARAGIAWFAIKPALSGGAISAKTHVSKQGYLAAQGLYLMYPHIEASSSGTVAMVFSFGGPGTYLSAAYATLSRGAFGPIRTAAAGITSDNGFTSTPTYGGVGRWGDYSAGQLDPSGSGIWFATQYIGGNGDQFANWSNRVFEIAG
ncbi:MAG: hypothetical protein ACRDID_02830 [Ktedonobacterales bacterium]